MPDWTAAGPSMIASFMASLVEFVEALTVVLAVGVVRGWRSALIGTGAALVLLVALIVTLGQSLSKIPLPVVQLAVGTLLLLFGLRWLCKAVLRAAGVLPLHNEAQAFAVETEALRRQAGARHQALDSVAFAAAFKIVMLEGIEVVFIVVAIGASGRLIVPASIGALLALIVVVILGLWLHRPLGNVPENALKFGVGVMLAAFGTFWAGEGIGLQWPGGDGAIIALIVVYLAIALALVQLCRRRRLRRPLPSIGNKTTGSDPQGVIAIISHELVGLFVDDSWLAGGILLWVLGAWPLQAQHVIAMNAACSTFAGGLAALLVLSALRRAGLPKNA